MSRNGFARMDIDTHWAYHRKMRALQRLYPDTWPTFACAYWCLLGEAWTTRSCDVTLEDAWCPSLPCSVEEARSALCGTGFITEQGAIPAESWDDWYGPADRRFTHGRKAIEARWTRAMPEQYPSNTRVTTNQPASLPTSQSRAGARDDGSIDREEATTVLSSLKDVLGSFGDIVKPGVTQ